MGTVPFVDRPCAPHIPGQVPSTLAHEPLTEVKEKRPSAGEEEVEFFHNDTESLNDQQAKLIARLDRQTSAHGDLLQRFEGKVAAWSSSHEKMMRDVSGQLQEIRRDIELVSVRSLCTSP